MCGIIGYIGAGEAYPKLIEGLKRLEYRGYDSAGIALHNEKVNLYKKQGKISALEGFVSDKDTAGAIGIGHTRWATHGGPNDVNAHPQQSMNGLFTIVHNGIIENYETLGEDLIKDGYAFQSQTDTEVLCNLIEYFYINSDTPDAEEAIRSALSKVIGAYGLAVICANEADKIIASRKGSPLIIGLGNKEYFLASDAAAIVKHTSNIVYLNDNDIAILKHDLFTLKNLNNHPVSLTVEQPKLYLGEIDKGDFDHFMEKEIFEQPKIVKDTLRGRLNSGTGDIKLGGLIEVMPNLVAAKRIIIIGCGTSWHAGLIGEYWIERYARIPVEVEYASEFRYRNPVLGPEDVVIAISQSGETADTLAAAEMAKEKSATVLGICNVPGSTLSRLTKAGVFTHAGVEIGVASTKAFLAQTTVLLMLTAKLSHEKKTITSQDFETIINELAAVPEKIEDILKESGHIKKIGEKYKDISNALFLGRGNLFPVALEGALKLKEISYIHAEGYAAGEMKHGPIALIDDNLPVIVIAPNDAYYEKILSNIREVKARRGNVIAVINKSDSNLEQLSDEVIRIPATHPAITPLVAIIPLQLLAYHIAVLRGCNVDQPRNLAKSVTVE